MTLFEQFKTFAKAKPRDEVYYSGDGQNCAVAQFAKSIDPDFYSAGFRYYYRHKETKDAEDGILTVDILDGKSGDGYLEALWRSHTWGVLSDRLEKLDI